MSIPGLDAWLKSVQGRYILDWEQATLDEFVADVFGFNALQLGLPPMDFLRSNRIPLRQKACQIAGADVLCNLDTLPFASNSIDLIVLPHVLEFSKDPHQILREVERILIPEGQLIVLGFNPLSMWGMKHRFSRSGQFPWNGRYLSLARLKDWLQLLGFELDGGTHGCYAPPLQQKKWLQRWHLIESAGERSWNFAGAVYALRAIKRVHGMRLIAPRWKKTPVSAKALRPVAQKERQ